MSVRRWILPLVLVSVLVFVLSLRQLSDPDLGFHLKYGEWIVLNHTVPVHDLSTYTVQDHVYLDMHWLFQVVLYGTFRMGGYSAISFLVCGLSMLLYLLLWLRLKSLGIPRAGTGIALVCAFLIIDPRIAPRPEMLTFLFMVLIPMILDEYVKRRKNLLYILPLIMVLWCNMHALFILGLIIIWVYFISDLIRSRKADRKLLLWTVVSCFACLINPYGIKGFVLPIE